MSNDLDELMSRDPMDLSNSDLDAIIDFQRKARARRASGEKPAKPTASASIDISAVTNKLIWAAKPEVKITRRV